MTVDGVVVDTDEFLTTASSQLLVYNGDATGGLQGVVDFGPVLPTGLDSPEVHEMLVSPLLFITEHDRAFSHHATRGRCAGANCGSDCVDGRGVYASQMAPQS